MRKLERVVPRVVRVEEMQHKIVVVDERVTMVGSCNTLSHRASREIMVVHGGRRFGARLLEHEHADLFRSPPACRPLRRRHRGAAPVKLPGARLRLVLAVCDSRLWLAAHGPPRQGV